MARADLPLSIRSAMSGGPAEPATSAVDPHEPASAPDGPPPRSSLKGRLFGRIADYARRYLTASVEHRMTLVQTDLGVMRQQLAIAEATNARLEARLNELIVYTSEHRDQISAQIWQSHDDVTARIGAVPGALGPRFDELEMKVRPLITYDEASYAIRLRDGYAMVPRSTPAFALMIANATSGGLEPGTRRVLQALIQPGMGVADVGANIGLLTLACATATGPTGAVYAFEPEAVPRSQLEKTLYINGLSWVVVSDHAVGAKRAKLTFHVSPIIGHSSLYALPAEEGEATAIKVQVETLDAMVAPGQRLDVVKIDVEGAELDVLAGMPRLLAENPDLALVVEYGPSHLTRVGLTPEGWFAAFAAHGYEPHAIDEATGTARPVALEDLSEVMSVNIAFVRPGGGAAKRLPR